jgi:hypothetical protein
MQILYDASYDGEHGFIKMEEKNGHYVKYEILEDIEGILHRTTCAKDTYFFLREEYFDLYSFDIFQEFDTPCTRADLESITREKRLTIQQEYDSAAVELFHYVDVVYEQWLRKEHVMWTKGSVFFRISFVCLQQHMHSKFTMAKWAKWCRDIRVYPDSFFTIDFIKKELGKDSFYLLYMHQSYAKLIHVSNGFYRMVETMNLGVEMLKQIYKDNGVIQFFYTKRDEINAQPLVKDIVITSVDFFTEMLSKWLGEFITRENDLILISPLTTNSYFQESFNKRYNHYINGFILPFHHSDNLQTFNRNRTPDEMDILTFVNTKNDIEAKLLY